MASVEAKTETVVNEDENEEADVGDEVTDDGKAVVAKKSKKKKKPKKPSKLKLKIRFFTNAHSIQR